MTPERARALLAGMAAAPAAETVDRPTPLPLGLAGFVASGTDPETVAPPDLIRLGANPADWGSSFGIRQDDETWAVLTADGSVSWTANSYQEALARIADEMAVDRPGTLSERWRSEMAYEGVSTGDGRFIEPGAIEFRNTPLPLMLQTSTDVGHFGAVLAGAIETVSKDGQTAIGMGSYDDSEAGRQFRDIVAARGRFGVSIDVADADGDFVCTEQDQYGDCVDGEFHFSLIRIMGLTGTPFPAFENAYITNEEAPAEPAPAATAEPCVDCGNAASQEIVTTGFVSNGVTVTAGGGGGTTVTASSTLALVPAAELVAAAAPLSPPEAWFTDPELDRPTPLTVTSDGRVYGHIATWSSCHTSYADRCVPPPRSKSGYAYFTTGALVTAEGTTVRVGQLTMGCGHASDSASLSAKAAKAHYDGGPGAIQMADVAVGEDRFGIWFSGALRPDVTDEQIREFQAQALSGDWRTVKRGMGLELVAALSVPVPGFPIAASGAPAVVELPQAHAVIEHGETVVLVAAGIVRPRLPWEDAFEALRVEVDDLRAQLASVAIVASAFRGEAAERLIASVLPDT